MKNSPKKWLPPLGGAALLGLLILWMSGVLGGGRISPGENPPSPGLPAPAQTGKAQKILRPVWHEAVGTVQSRTRATVSAQVTGRVTAVRAEAGQTIGKDDLLATLDDRESNARLEQARSGREAAIAARNQAQSNHKRMAKLHEENAATPQDLEAAVSAKEQAEAGVAAAEQKVLEAEVMANHTKIKSPLAGVLAERKIEPGDLAWPGKPLFLLHDPEALRLEVDVREGLIDRIRKGDKLDVRLNALEKTVKGTVEEVLPSADPVSRSFRVRITLPVVQGLHPGMFGRLRLPLDKRETIVVPREAVTRVGQLETILVQSGERWTRRYLKTAPLEDGRAEVLSGLSGGECIGWNGGNGND